MRPIITLHKNLTYEDWDRQDIFAMMGNIGSEVNRTVKWKSKNKEKMWRAAFERSLELFDISKTSPALTESQRHEIGRAREAWCDYVVGDNIYSSNSIELQKYFDQFAIARSRV
jgi:hypothetical protein